MNEGINEGFNKVESIETKLKKLEKRLGDLISGVPEDFAVFYAGDTLDIVSDRAFMKSIIKDLSGVEEILSNDNKTFKNVRREDGDIHADLVEPIGDISKIKLRIEKTRV